MDTAELIQEWLDSLSASGRKAITIDTYRKNIRQCLRVLERDGRPTSPYEIGPEDFVYLKDALTQKEEVRRAYMRVLAMFCLHCTGQDPMKKANLLFNREHRDRVFIDDADFIKLYDNASPTMRMVIMLGGVMGLRRAEICSIRDEDIRGGYIIVHGKGHGDGLTVKCRIPPIVEEEIAIYRQWKSTKPNSGDGYLIQNGRTLSKVSISGMSNYFRLFTRRISVTATLHSLRRYYAMTLYNATQCDIITVAKLMRHADTSTTARCYLNACDNREREAVAKVDEHVTTLIGHT